MTAMKAIRKFVLVLSASVLGVGVHVMAGQSATRPCTTEECACEDALRKNTVEALEEFLRKYPQSVDNGNSACAALAVPPADAGAGDETTQERTPVQTDGTSYGG
jgi:hypothetical protein